MQPKTAKRRSAFRRANRIMPRRRIDIAVEAIDYKNPDLLKKFVTESGKILPRRVTGMPAHLHRRITREITLNGTQNRQTPFRVSRGETRNGVWRFWVPLRVISFRGAKYAALRMDCISFTRAGSACAGFSCSAWSYSAKAVYQALS